MNERREKGGMRRKEEGIGENRKEFQEGQEWKGREERGRNREEEQ